MTPRRIAILLGAVALAACNSPKASPPASELGPAAPPGRAAERAALGAPAPDFELRDLDGKPVKLSAFAGKIVVLEWFNPGCPYVQRAHAKGSLQGTGSRWDADPDVVWLAINSGAPGKQGHGVETNREAAERFGIKHPVLLDESGVVGRKYGATNTPHMFVIDAKGVLVYAGAIDNSPDGEGESPSDGKLVRYVEQALEAVKAGRAVPVAKTEAYGCSVKYGS
ncbi:MAG: redoxin family protein [Myxococcales bacterium]|nr:redoxin family protein [Myxococcales bacterium]